MKCTAHKTNGESCGAWAVKGRNVCRVHGAGGNQLAKVLVANTKHGRYSGTKLPPFLTAYERFSNDPNALDLGDEIALSRAALNALVEEANNDPTIGPFAIQGAVESVAKVVSAENKRRQTLNTNQVLVFMARLMDEMRNSLDDCVSKPDERAAFLADFKRRCAGLVVQGVAQPV